MPLAQRLKLLAWAKQNTCWLIEDDYDSELRYLGKPIPSLQGLDQHGNVIYMGTFSKTLFPALRLAYLVLPDRALTESFKLLKAVSDRQSPLTDQLILNDFIREGYFHRHIRKMRVLYNERLQFLMRQLEEHLPGQLSFSDPSAGMHLPAYFKRPVDEERLQARAGERGLILPGIKGGRVGVEGYYVPIFQASPLIHPV
jgi:GntR family transcriptional regulator / MocR family aminotransferase